MRFFLCFFLGLATPFLQAKPPNIVFILADDLGYGELGSYGQRRIMTPRLDALANEGIRFTQNYSGNAVCAPSRCVLLSGKHPGNAHVRNNSEVRPEGQKPIPDDEVTIAELLKARGYATGAFGKWGLGFPGSEGDPLKQGFDRFFGYNCQRHAHSYYPDYLWDDARRIELDNDPPVPGHASFPKGIDAGNASNYMIFKGKDYAPDRINEQVLKFIREHHTEPFFVFYPTVIPHLALHVPDEDLKPYLEKGWNDPPFTRAGGRGYTPHFRPRAAYAAMITRLDSYVGKVLDLLESLSIQENTIVIFTSDNGTSHVKAEVDYDFFKSVGALHGLKGSLYEGGVRVPLIVRWTGKIRAGSVSDFRTGFEDWLPTLMDLISSNSNSSNSNSAQSSNSNSSNSSESSLPSGIDGISILPTLMGAYQRERAHLYREFTGYGGQQAVWLGPWKGIRQRMLRGPEPLRTALYHLPSDESESRDVSSQHPEIVAQIEAIMLEQHHPSDRFPFPPLD